MMKHIQNLKEHFYHDVRKIFANKFVAVFTIVVLYFIFASWHFGLKDGFLVMALTWSFFVLATPIPDGGIILDLPIRYFTGIKMLTSEIFVWAIAIGMNILCLVLNQEIYDKTFLLTIFKDIMIEPIPYSLIIILSGVGTFFTLYIGDEVYDVLSHKKSDRHKKHSQKLKLVVLVSIIVFVMIMYELLLKHLGVKFF